MIFERFTLGRITRVAVLLLVAGLSFGCKIDSFFNPSVQGYWENTPTTMPILSRIDAIEPQEDAWGQTSEPTPEDLIPSDLSYRMVPGDFVTISIFELYSPQQWHTSTRRIDAGGFLRVPELGEVQGAGLSPQEFEDAVVVLLEELIMSNAQVDIVVEEGGAFRYTIYGAVMTPGSFQLRTPDLSLLEALAQAGGIPDQVEYIYVIRRIPLTEETRTPYERGSDNGRTAPARPGNGTPPVDIEDLIDQLDDDEGVSPGVLRQDGEPAIDIDELAPPRAGDEPAVDIESIPGRTTAGGGGSWVYVEERNEWVRVPAGRRADGMTALVPGEPPLYAERVIEVKWEQLSRGDSRSNIVVRPDDLIYIQAPITGLVYLGGQIVLPGPFSIPPDGVTLSRMIDTAGGLNQLAIPERVDLIRIVGPNREAVIRVNLAAILNRTEPDIYLKPDDHIIVGTNFWAAPLAVMRNGFRATYGYGFLLDRNFGNDVFGAPPTNRQGL